MVEREKVIKGLGEILVYCHEQFGENDHDVQAQLTRMNQTAKDAIELLKVQEPRVMTLEEVMALEEGTGDVWIEDAPIPGRVPCISATTMMDKSTLDSDGEVEFFDCSIYAITDYNANRANGWRCWTARPTEEQMKAVKWDG